MSVRIVGATLRDLSYVASNLRPEDHAEISCQVEHWSPAWLAATALSGPAWVAEVDGNPEAGFGAAEQRKGLWIAWSWGTRRMARAVPHMTRFVRQVTIPLAIANGCFRCEARAMASNAMAVKWLSRLGSNRCADLPMYGMNGEDFVLFEWTKDAMDVLLQRQTSGSSSASTGSDGQ